MMELQWGGGAEGAARFNVFRREICSAVRASAIRGRDKQQ